MSEFIQEDNSLKLASFGVKLRTVGTSSKNVSENYLLHPLSLSIRHSTLTAIIGQSGSGKTSLLSALAGRFDASRLEVTGSTSIQSKDVGYVAQTDFLLPFLTVFETLLLVAKLKIAKRALTDGDTHESIVEGVIKDLGLRECVDSRINNTQSAQTDSRGISGGEMRRVSVGIQLLSNPSGAFLICICRYFV